MRCGSLVSCLRIGVTAMAWLEIPRLQKQMLTFNKVRAALLFGPLCFGALLTATAAEPPERIVVVGSRAVSPQIAGDTSVPIDVLTAQDIARTGITETGKLLQVLVPSFNFSFSTVSDGTDTVRPATLRGLWPDQVLVLINGKRRHTSALVHVNGSVGRGTSGTDLNAIPSSAIERIEVLRDGAAAQYGSDAIAGVINIVLKSQAQGGEVATYWGQTYKGDGEQFRALFNGGLGLGSSGFINVTAERRNRGYTNRAGDNRYRVGDAESDNDYFFINSELPLEGDTSLYAFGGASEREARSAGFFRTPVPALADLHADCQDGDTTNDGNCPSPRNVNSIYPNGFLPMIEPEVDDESLTGGIRGLWGDWNWDASVNYGSNRFDFIISNSLNVTLGANSPTRVDAGGLEFTQTTWNFDAVRKIDWLASLATFATGLEYRVDDYELHAGEPDSWRDGGEEAVPDYDVPAPPGIQVFPGFQPANEVSEDRESYAGYFDVEAYLSDKFRFGAALRYEDYSDFGDNLSGKLTGRYDFVETFALRGAVSTGFRAPSLGQQYFNSISTQFINGAPFEVTTLRNNDPFLRELGVDELEEEESFHLSLGAVMKPVENMTIAVDAYYIDIDDRITLSSQYSRDDVPTEVLDRDSNERGREIGRFQFFTNAVDTRTRGVDVTASYFFELDNGGTLDWSVAGNFGSTSASSNVNEPAGLVDDAKSVFDLRERIWLEDGQPGQHYTFAVNYAYCDYDFTVRTSRYGSVRSAEEDSSDTVQEYEAKWVTDIVFNRHFPQGLTWTVGAQNLFNQYPERNDPDIVENANIFTYNRRVSPFGINGGYYYTSLKYEF